MENEKFQDLVLEHLAKLTQSITELKTGQEELRTGQKELRKDMEEIKGGQQQLEAKLELVYNHTVKLSEDLTITNQKLDTLHDDVNYLKHKQAQNEEDIFKIKSYLKITK